MKLLPKFETILSSSTASVQVLKPNFVSALPAHLSDSQDQTKQAFSSKWNEVSHTSADYDTLVEKQKAWYLELYGFPTEADLAAHLKKCDVMLDAGAGKGGKAAWFAELSPSTLVVAADISDGLDKTAEHYKNLDNLLFVQCDIAALPFLAEGTFDYVSCDQVIHHTADPFKTFKELVRLTKPGHQLALYVYRKKALPRELLDDHFREFSQSLKHDELMALSQQLTDLGKILSAHKQEIDFPAVPLMGIEGGKMTFQRFLYWNFMKCFWNDEMGPHNSMIINYDWYSPSQAFRYSEEEFREWMTFARLSDVFFHREAACYSGRFQKPQA